MSYKPHGKGFGSLTSDENGNFKIKCGDIISDKNVVYSIDRALENLSLKFQGTDYEKKFTPTFDANVTFDFTCGRNLTARGLTLYYPHDFNENSIINQMDFKK